MQTWSNNTGDLLFIIDEGFIRSVNGYINVLNGYCFVQETDKRCSSRLKPEMVQRWKI